LLEEQGIARRPLDAAPGEVAVRRQIGFRQLVASRGRSGPRSMVSNGLPPNPERQARSSGSPSIRAVMIRTAGQAAAVSVRLAR
jgi:hypothetical protein